MGKVEKNHYRIDNRFVINTLVGETINIDYLYKRFELI